MYEMTNKHISARPHERHAYTEVQSKNGADDVNLTLHRVEGASITGMEFSVERSIAAQWKIKWARELVEPATLTILMETSAGAQYEEVQIVPAEALPDDPEGPGPEPSIQDGPQGIGSMAVRIAELMAQGMSPIDASTQAQAELTPKPPRPDVAQVIAAQMATGMSPQSAAEVAQAEVDAWESKYGAGKGETDGE